MAIAHCAKSKNLFRNYFIGQFVLKLIKIKQEIDKKLNYQYPDSFRIVQFPNSIMRTTTEVDLKASNSPKLQFYHCLVFIGIVCSTLVQVCSG